MELRIKKTILILFIIPLGCFAIVPPRNAFFQTEMLDSTFIGLDVQILLKSDLTLVEITGLSERLTVHEKGDAYNHKGDKLTIGNNSSCEKIIKKFKVISVTDSMTILNFRAPHCLKEKHENISLNVKNSDLLGVWAYRSKWKKILSWTIYISYQVVIVGTLGYLLLKD